MKKSLLLLALSSLLLVGCQRDSEVDVANGKPIGYMYGDGSFDNPYKSSVVTAGDIYFSGYTNGVRGYGDWSIGTNSQCYHMYIYKLKNKDAKIKVEATDRFGNIYTETEITKGTDYSTVKY